jgi:hypothetical protein
VNKKQLEPSVETQLAQQAKAREEYIEKETIRLEAEHEIKDRKLYLKEAAMKVARKKRDDLLAQKRSEREVKDRAMVRKLGRAQRIAYRRRLTGGYFPDHIRDELDRMDGLKPDMVTEAEVKEASTESLLAMLRGRGIEALPVNKPVTERVPAGVGADVDWEEENAAD